MEEQKTSVTIEVFLLIGIIQKELKAPQFGEVNRKNALLAIDAFLASHTEDTVFLPTKQQ